MSSHDDVRAAVRAVLEAEASSADVRRMLDDEAGFDPRLWRTISDLGWPAMHVPEAYGGLGQPFSALAVILHELGRRVTPLPFLSTAVLVTTALLASDNESKKRELLPALASGQLRGALALTGSSGRLSDVGMRHVRAGAGFRLHGTAAFVLDAHTSGLLVLRARDDAGADAVFAIPADRAGLQVQRTPGVDQTRRLCTVSATDVHLSAADVLAQGPAATRLIDHVIDVGALAVACDCLGGAERSLEMITAYAKERVQFGRPIGSFQAVKHKCADMLLLVEGTRAAVEHAAEQCSLEQIGDPGTTAGLAKAYAGEAFVEVAGDSMQLHGGIGFTWEHDMHLFLKRAALNHDLLGSPSWHRERLAVALFGGDA